METFTAHYYELDRNLGHATRRPLASRIRVTFGTHAEAADLIKEHDVEAVVYSVVERDTHTRAELLETFYSPIPVEAIAETHRRIDDRRALVELTREDAQYELDGLRICAFGRPMRDHAENCTRLLERGDPYYGPVGLFEHCDGHDYALDDRDFWTHAIQCRHAVHEAARIASEAVAIAGAAYRDPSELPFE